jgi:nucleoside-diphosphate-sugar epimerase
MSLVHVDDVVDLLLECVENAPPGSVYFCSDGTPRSWNDIIRVIGKSLGRQVRPVRVPPTLLWPAALMVEALRPFLARPPVFCLGKLREAAQRSWVCSPGRARRELGFEPRISFEEGAASTAAWYREAGWLRF